MTMIDKMARAIYEVSSEPEHGADWEGLSPEWRDNLNTHARAALTALLEPTAGVIDKGIDALEDCVDSDFSSNADGERDYYTTIRSDAAALTFRAMIQAALDEHP